MEKRQCERVQFFQVPLDKSILPVWVFRRAGPDALLGLLLDVSPAGARILTDKAHVLDEGVYRLIVQADGHAQEPPFLAQARHVWSRTDGALHSQHGLAFEGDDAAAASLASLLAARAAGQQWLRCELARV